MKKERIKHLYIKISLHMGGERVGLSMKIRQKEFHKEGIRKTILGQIDEEVNKKFVQFVKERVAL